MKSEYISFLEKTVEPFSVLSVNVITNRVYDFFIKKQFSLVYEQTNLLSSGSFEVVNAVFMGPQKFYFNLTKNLDDWDLKVYYRSYQRNELQLLMNHLIKQLEDETNY